MVVPDDLLKAARDWAAKGYISPWNLAQIEHELEQRKRQEANQPRQSQSALFGIGGLVLAAAFLALTVLMDLGPLPSAWTLASLGAVMLGIGLALGRETRHPGWEALTVAGLGDLVAAAIMSGLTGGLSGHLIHPIVLALAVGLPWTSRRHVVPALATLGAYVILPSWLWHLFEHASDAEEVVATIFLLLAGTHLAVIVVMGRANARPWHNDIVLLTTLACAVGVVWFTFAILEPGFTGGYEVIIGVAMLLLLAVGIGIRESGMVIGAGPVLAIDAVVFAFDVGGLWTGFLTLLAVAGLLIGLGITQGGKLRKVLSPPSELRPRGPA
jgi:hypothetical protein